MCFSGRVATEKRLFREIVMTYENPQYPQLSSKASGREEFHCGSDQASEAIASGFGSEAGEEDTCGEVSGGGPQRWHCGCSGASASQHHGWHANGTDRACLRHRPPVRVRALHVRNLTYRFVLEYPQPKPRTLTKPRTAKPAEGHANAAHFHGFRYPAHQSTPRNIIPRSLQLAFAEVP